MTQTHISRRLASRLTLALALATPLLSTIAIAPAFAEPNHAEAKAHFLAGQQHFDLNEYDAAIEEYKLAFKADPSPVFLYNIAQSYRLKAELTPTRSDCTNGVAFYKKFLSKQPGAKNAEQITAWIGQLQACVDKIPAGQDKPAIVAPPPTIAPPPTVVTPPAPTTVTPPPPTAIVTAPMTTTPVPKPEPTKPVVVPPPTAVIEPKPSVIAVTHAPITKTTSDENAGHGLRVASYVSFGVGIAAVAGGTFFAVHANSLAGPLTDACKTSCTWTADQQNTLNDVHDDNNRARIMFGVGGAGLVAGTVLYVLGHRGHGEQAPIAFAPTDGGAMLVTSGNF